MAGPEAAWFCYMLRCSDRSLYVGIAIDVEDRVKRHNWGVGPKYTATRRPVELIWQERCGSCEAARAREKEIKGWSRKKKFELLAGMRGKPFAPKTGAQGKGESSNG
jgi:putative endonuclease